MPRKPIALEEGTIAQAWGCEDVLKAMQDNVFDGLTSPKKFDDIKDLDEYEAVFIPCGQGPVIDPNPLFCAFAGCDHDSLCHGTNTLRSPALEREFPHNGYKIRVLPDSVDDQSSQIGHLLSDP